MTTATNIPRIGVIGCGAIADIYHLPALEQHARAKQGIALADPNEHRLSEMANKYRAAYRATDYRELVGHVDGVIVATPPGLHHPISKFFLEQGVHVLCEKPLTESLVEAQELVELANRHQVGLAVNQTRRLFPTYQKIRDLISAGTLGELQSITYHDGIKFDWPAASPHHFKPDAKGAWSDTGVHLLDAVCYWLGSKPDLVSSQNDAMGGPEAMATVRLRQGACHVEIKVSRLGRLMNGFRIVGENGSIAAEAEDWDEFDVLFHGTPQHRQRFKCASNRLQYRDFAHPLIQNFVDVVDGKAQPLISAKSTLGTIELLEAAYAQATLYDMPWNHHWQEVCHVR